jgi:plastocyanin domain-containing protein
MEMNNIVKVIAFVLIIIMGIVAVKSFATGSIGLPTANVVAVDSNNGEVYSGEIQTVEVSFKNYEYFPNPIELKKGVTTRLVFDLNTVQGCMRAVRIPTFNVEKYVKEGDNVIEFTPDKAGEFSIMCSMGMGTGVIKVVEADGSVPEVNDETLGIAAPVGGTCGASGGGCGCSG